LVILAVAAAAAAQWIFNQWRVGVAALLPAVVLSHSLGGARRPILLGASACLGAAIVIAAAAGVRLGQPPDRVPHGSAPRYRPSLGLS
jgi:hypothetical protein